jgi:hypothetical protein
MWRRSASGQVQPPAARARRRQPGGEFIVAGADYQSGMGGSANVQYDGAARVPAQIDPQAAADAKAAYRPAQPCRRQRRQKLRFATPRLQHHFQHPAVAPVSEEAANAGALTSANLPLN